MPARQIPLVERMDEHRAPRRVGWLIAGLTVAVLAPRLFGPARPAETGSPAAADPKEVYDPVQAGETRPPGYPAVGARPDPARLRPVFTSSGDVEEDAKAYPVSYLNRREMLIDSLEGIPILVTWRPLCGTAKVHRRDSTATLWFSAIRAPYGAMR